MANIWENVLSGFKEIFLAPTRDLSILWLLIPIFLFWFTLEIYFGRYKEEKLGWNSALGYGLSMFWIVIISFRTLFANNFELFSIDKLLFVIFIALYSCFIIFVSFTHRMKAKIFFLFTSPTLVYFLFGIALLLVNDLLNVTFWVIVDLVIFYIIILIFELILKKIIPPAPNSSGMEEPQMSSESIGNIGKSVGKL